MNGTEINSDTITLSGTVLDGAEQDEVYVEVGLYDTVFNESAISKYNLAVEEKWDKSENLGNGDAFQLNLNMRICLITQQKCKGCSSSTTREHIPICVG